MQIGTAGYTAMLCVLGLEDFGIKADRGEILVTGASGGVGSVAVSLLSSLGFSVIASTGRLSETDYLKSLGASSVIDRNELSEPSKPLGKERWIGAVDSVGSQTLSNVFEHLWPQRVRRAKCPGDFLPKTTPRLSGHPWRPKRLASDPTEVPRAR